MIKIKSKNKKGFALLYAILLTSAVLIVGVSLINIITQQLILTSLNKGSQIAYYNARSIVSCLDFFDNKDYFLEYSETEAGQVDSVKSSAVIRCLAISNSDLNLNSNQDLENPNVYYFGNSLNLGNNGSVKLKFAYNLDHLKDPTYSGCDQIGADETFESSCARIITVEGSNLILDSISSRKVERTSLRFR